jgi:hypothetical protein
VLSGARLIGPPESVKYMTDIFWVYTNPGIGDIRDGETVLPR